jgi:O-succinylbenzoic acid--CoA ligase
MTIDGVREILVDGPDGVPELIEALRAALDGGPAVLPLAKSDPRLPAIRERLAPGRPAEPGTAVVVTTSGSTGDAKGVLLSAAALRASAAATHARLGGPGQWLLALPAQHVAGIQVLVRSLLAGYEPVVTGRAQPFAQRFADAAQALAAPRRYTSLVPTHLARMLADGDLALLQTFDAVLVGGAAAPPPLVEQARAAGVQVVATYGMSETCGGCVYDGVPLDDVGVRIAGGVIELGGPVLASGYRLDPAATANAFVDGWFRTTDLGVLHDGVLEVLGRADFVINTGGVKVEPAAVEAVLTALPGVAEACVVDLPSAEWGQIVAAAVVPAKDAAGGPPAVGDLLDAVRSALGGPAVPKLVRFAGTLPVRGPGKVDRAAVRELLRTDGATATPTSRP